MPRRIAIAVVSVPCLSQAGGCGAEIEQPCSDPTWPAEHAPRYHKCRSALARQVGLEYVDTLDQIDKLPEQ